MNTIQYRIRRLKQRDERRRRIKALAIDVISFLIVMAFVVAWYVLTP